jgi:phytoene dehydrogenase-like protein
MDPFPPLRRGARLLAALGGPGGMLELARFGLLPVRRLAHERFRGAIAARLLAGTALPAGVSPEAPGGALYASLLLGLGEHVGWPAPEGGAGRLTAALVARLEAAGGRVVCGSRVDRAIVRRGRTVAVRCADGREIGAHRAILADVGAPQRYRSLLEPDAVPDRVLRALERFEYDPGTVKVDWALDGPIPWTAPDAARAGTLHITRGLDALTLQSAQLARGEIPRVPLAGQHAHFDPSHPPAGMETAWAHTHVPRGDWSARSSTAWPGGWRSGWRPSRPVSATACSPGTSPALASWRPRTPTWSAARSVAAPPSSISSSCCPSPGLGRAETPVRRLYLASASAHPGAGVHGACGANAARAALAHARLRLR